MKTYQAPWGKSLKVVSGLLVVLAVVAVFGAPFLPHGSLGWSIQLLRWALPVAVLGFLPFMVLGYEITADAIYVRRPLWKTRLDRRDLKSAAVVPDAMSKCIRVCGNGGGFSFTGWYWKASLGIFHAYATDQKRTVVLRFGKRTAVVSPDEPEDFVKELSA